MEKRSFPTLSETPSLLGFGCMRFPTLEDKSIDYPKAKEMVDYAMAHGVNYYDTAYVYHEEKSEEFIARALVKDYPRESFYIADKMPVWNCKEYADFDRLFEEQLQRLNTDYIDFYLVHCLNKENWDNMYKLDIGKFLKEKKREGKIHHIGFSFHDSPEVLKEILDSFDGWDFAQIQMNYFDWTFQHAKEQYELLTERGLPVVVMESIRGGALANFQGAQAEFLTAVHPDRSFASWAIRWLAQHDNVMTVLSGMSTLDQVKDNVATYSPVEPMTEEELGAIERLVDYMNSIPLIPCTGCRYCVKDCPKNIGINDIFHQYNEYTRFGAENQLTYWYLQNTNQERLATACIKCGKCKTMCPQHIDVPAELERIHALALSVKEKSSN